MISVHGVEYAFGSHEHATTGISGGEPRQGNGFAFRKQILIGFTEKKWMEVRGVMEELAEDYKGNSYNLIARNCNHFCNDACVRLTGNAIPSWINRLAKIGTPYYRWNLHSSKTEIKYEFHMFFALAVVIKS